MEKGLKIESMRCNLDSNTVTDSLDFGRESLGILPPDFGRESLGILPPDFGKESLGFFTSDIGRESLGFFPSDVGRESLGFSNASYLDELRNPLEPRNFFHPNFENDSMGRESLGILHLSAIDSKIQGQNFKTPDLLLTTISEPGNESVCDIFNKAFLLPSPRKFSLTSTCSYVSFNANSIEEPSKIFSIPSPYDDVFAFSSVASTQTRLNKTVFDNHLKECNRLRIKSLPNIEHTHKLQLTKNSDCMDFTGNDMSSSKLESFPSLLNKGQLMRTSEMDSQMGTDSQMETDSQMGTDSQINQKVKSNSERENICHDSLLIEGRYFADKLANGSLLNDSFQDEIGVLDNVPHPNWQEFATPEKDVPLNKEVSNDEEPNESEYNIKSVPIKIHQTPKEARELLNNLSEILNNTPRSDQQRSEGQHLLNSLAELLSDGSNVRSSNLDDSGHSSFINDNSDPEKQTSPDMMDLNKKNYTVPVSESHSINNSQNSTEKSKLGNIYSNRLSLSLNSALPSKVIQHNLFKKANLSRISLDSSKNRTGSSSNSSVKSDSSSGILSSMQHNLKLKTNKEASRKGPLKAMIPLKELKKTAKTPDKTENGMTMQSKRTSTPINEPKLKPVAASTPTQLPPLRSNSAEIASRKSLPSSTKMRLSNVNPRTHGNVQSKSTGNCVKPRRSLPICTSPLARNVNPKKQDNPSSSSEKVQKNSKLLSFKDKLPSPSSKQPSNPNLHGMENRRNSISSLRKDQLPERPRRNSLSKEPAGTTSSISKIRMPSPSSKQPSNSNLDGMEKRRNSISSPRKDQLPERPRRNSLSKEPVGTTSSISKIRMPSPSSKQPINSNLDGMEKRRNSISSLRKDQLPERPRRNSLSKEPVGIMSSISKIRENLLNSPEYRKIRNKSLLKENNNTKEKAEQVVSLNRKKLDLIPSTKKMGKENMGK